MHESLCCHTSAAGASQPSTRTMGGTRRKQPEKSAAKAKKPIAQAGGSAAAEPKLKRAKSSAQVPTFYLRNCCCKTTKHYIVCDKACAVSIKKRGNSVMYHAIPHHRLPRPHSPPHPQPLISFVTLIWVSSEN